MALKFYSPLLHPFCVLEFNRSADEFGASVPGPEICGRELLHPLHLRRGCYSRSISSTFSFSKWPQLNHRLFI